MHAMPDKNPDAFEAFRNHLNDMLAAGRVVSVTGLGGWCMLAPFSVIEAAGPQSISVRSPSGKLAVYTRRPNR